MNFEPQCKTRADLHREWARVLDMCESAGFKEVIRCVKCDGIQLKDACYYPRFDGALNDYELAIAIVEGRPVFRGGWLYDKEGTTFQICEDGNAWVGGACQCSSVRVVGQKYIAELLSWNPPQRTIEINGVKVKEHTDITVYVPLDNSVVVNFKTPADAEAFKAAMEGK